MSLRLNITGIVLVFCVLILHGGVVTLLYSAASRGESPHTVISREIVRVSGRQVDGFTVTAYCPARCCNGVWAGKTSGGNDIAWYRERGIDIAAVDPAVIPLGTYFWYGDRRYLAIDTGGLIRGRRIDILFDNHADTERFGVKRSQSLIIEQ